MCTYAYKYAIVYVKIHDVFVIYVKLYTHMCV